MPTFLLVFDSTHSALAAQVALEHLSPRLIPTPRQITAGCGMALRFEAEGTIDPSSMDDLRNQTTAEEGCQLYVAIQESPWGIATSYCLVEL